MIGTEDLEKMTTLEITKKLVSLFKEYDSLKDDELNILEDNPNRDMWDDETEETYDNLCKNIVDKYDEIKTICEYDGNYSIADIRLAIGRVLCNRLGIEV